MDFLSNLALGFSVVLTPTMLLYCFCGVTLGTLVGILPGIGPVTAIALLLPVTFNLSPEGSLIMLAGLYYGASYGGSTAAILMNVPGETSSVVTCIDGHAMARLGRAGTALSIAAIGSFVAGSVATLLISLFGPVLSEFALRFGPAEYFCLMVLGLVGAMVLAHGSLLRAGGMILLGLLFGVVGTDVETTIQRFMFGIPGLFDGIGFVVISMGIFGIAEILTNVQASNAPKSVSSAIGRILPTAADLKASAAPILRGTAMGSLLGILPGGGTTLSSFAAYALEKRVSKNPREFGNGAIAGVAAPEAANNAGAQTSFIPLLTLGVPSNGVMALMVGAMMIHGIPPGPQVMTQNASLFWGMIASMWVGNLMLLILNLPLVGIWVRLLMIPYRWLFPGIILFCCIGAYAVNNSTLDVFVMIVFSALGFLFLKFGCEPAPLLLGFILGPMMEEYLRRAMLIFRGDALGFFYRPISLVLILISALLLVVVLAPTMRDRRNHVFQE